MINQFYATGLNIVRNMNMNLWHSQRALERITTGQRINRAADDPAGLAISEKMRAQIRGLSQAARNIQDGMSLIQTAEGGLNETHAILQRMREITVQAANGTNSEEDRQALQMEYDELLKEISRISKDTQFNTMNVLDGKKSSIKLQVGPNSGQSIDIHLQDMSSAALGLAGSSIANAEAANEALGKLDGAISKVSSHRSYLGAMQNRLEHTLSNTLNMEENLIAAESRIRDADIAKEMMEFTKRNILYQAGQMALRLHMQQAHSILQLLKM